MFCAALVRGRAMLARLAARKPAGRPATHRHESFFSWSPLRRLPSWLPRPPARRRPPASRPRARHAAAGRALHLGGLRQLPVCRSLAVGDLSAGQARRRGLGARLPRRLLGPARLEGPLRVAAIHRAAARRHARQRRDVRVHAASPGAGPRHRVGASPSCGRSGGDGARAASARHHRARCAGVRRRDDERADARHGPDRRCPPQRRVVARLHRQRPYDRRQGRRESRRAADARSRRARAVRAVSRRRRRRSDDDRRGDAAGRARPLAGAGRVRAGHEDRRRAADADVAGCR